MALQVGIDSYVSLEEANKIVEENFTSDSTLFKKWSDISDSDKEVLLRQSTLSIDRLKLQGEKLRYGQKLQFPRKHRYIAGYGWRLFIGQFQDNGLIDGSGENNGLNEVAMAEVVNAVYAASYSSIVSDTLVNNIQGLTAKKAGPISENYGRNTPENSGALIGIYTRQVYTILIDWVDGTYIAL